jgi:hypothetical protein
VIPDLQDYLHPSVLIVFLASIGLAYVVGRMIRAYYERREANKPKPPLTRAERRRQKHGRK